MAKAIEQKDYLVNIIKLKRYDYVKNRVVQNSRKKWFIFRDY